MGEREKNTQRDQAKRMKKKMRFETTKKKRETPSSKKCVEID